MENIQRKNLDPLEEALAYKQYVDKFGCGGISELASKIGKSMNYIERRIRLLSLPEDIIMRISQGLLPPSIAEELLVVTDKEEQNRLTKVVLEKKLSCKSLRNIIKKRSHIPSNFYDLYDNSSLQDININKKTQRALDKTNIAIRIAMNNISDIMSEVKENWIVYESLFYHRMILHTQIDQTIKEKRKYKNR